MTTFGIPYLLEDRTGDLTNTEFDELYDRLFFGIARDPASNFPNAPTTVKIYELAARSSARSLAAGQFGRDPAVVLDLGCGAEMGSVLFVGQGLAMPVNSWVREVNGVKSFARKFRCSDGEDYVWVHAPDNADAEWVCTTSTSYLAADYSLCAPGEPKYVNSSGNVLTIQESYGHIALELLSALVVVRWARSRGK